MARPKSTLTADQKRARAAEYQRLRRQAQKNVDAGTTAAPPQRDAIALEINRVQAKIAARGTALLQQAIAAMTNGKTVAEVMRSFVDTAGRDAETEALVTLLASLQQSVAIRDRVAKGDFNVAPKLDVAVKPKPPAKKSRKRA